MLRAGTLLALGGATATLTGCDPLGRGGQPAAAPDPLAPLVDEALALAAAHTDAAAAHPPLADRLTPIAEAHRAHAAELAGLIGAATPTPSASASPSPAGDPAAALVTLRTREQAGRQSATAACAGAPADRAALLASIVAARATHVEVLR
ncbi:hypothetical protein [Micromonospora endolithica]|uniref:DUF4439 domain-containing protein n=1 Tax=Micromonospora endolithica TaxID=230091 RepID=A0A3A9ZLQ2_9ACTN|nr:hypothetical protein [Micromonospora endolithica]RKN49272.1 hypothetical protein D7223_07140 [Micromonospora endolithica]